MAVSHPSMLEAEKPFQLLCNCVFGAMASASAVAYPYSTLPSSIMQGELPQLASGLPDLAVLLEAYLRRPVPPALMMNDAPFLLTVVRHLYLLMSSTGLAQWAGAAFDSTAQQQHGAAESGAGQQGRAGVTHQMAGRSLPDKFRSIVSHCPQPN